MHANLAYATPQDKRLALFFTLLALLPYKAKLTCRRKLMSRGNKTSFTVMCSAGVSAGVYVLSFNKFFPWHVYNFSHLCSKAYRVFDCQHYSRG